MATASSDVGPQGNGAPPATGEHDSAFIALQPQPLAIAAIDQGSEKGPFRPTDDAQSAAELNAFAAYMGAANAVDAQGRNQLGWITSFDEWVYAPWLRWYPTWEDYEFELFVAYDRAVTATGCQLGFDEWTRAVGLALE